MQLLRQLADGADWAEESLTHRGGGLAQDGPSPPQQPRDDADAVADEAAVGGEVDVGLHRRGVDAELAAPSRLKRPGQLDDAVVELRHGPWPDDVSPTDECVVVEDLFEVDAAELPQHQAVVDKKLGLGIAPAIKPHNDEHAEDDLDGRGGPATRAGLWIATGEVASNEVEQLVVIEKAVELLQLRLEAEAELWDQGEPIDRLVAVLEHATA